MRGLVGFVSLCACLALLIWVFGLPLRAANRALDRRFGPMPADDYDDWDAVFAAGEEECEERLVRPGDVPDDLAGVARAVGVMWEPNPCEEAAVVRARALLAGGER